MTPVHIACALAFGVAGLACPRPLAAEAPPPSANPAIEAGRFQWQTGPPVVLPTPAGGESWHAIKDPSIVHHDGAWHLFCTVRGTTRSHAIVYLTFKDWPDASRARPHVLPCHPGYFCAPQVFYFAPHRQWYLVCQASAERWEPDYQPAFSRTQTLERPESWSPLEPLFDSPPAGIRAWLDFWVICDATRAHLFYTSLDGRMWRAETSLDRFPHGWSKPVVALEGDIFEASHTYRLRGQERYLTLVEAQNGHGWRYYKAYLADRLDGPWRPLAADRDRAFASMQNVTQPVERWTDAISHGELVRAGNDERLEIDPAELRFLFQGVRDTDRQDKPYGQIPWRLGLLEPVRRP